MVSLPAMPKFAWGLRARITAWYVLLVALTLVIFGAYLYLRFQSSLIAQVDDALEAAGSQALLNLETDDGRLVFEHRAIDFVGRVALFTAGASGASGNLVLADGASFQIGEETRLGVAAIAGMAVEVSAALEGDRLIALEIDEADGREGSPSGNLGLETLARLGASGLAFRLLGLDGTVWDEAGNELAAFAPPEASGFLTAPGEAGPAWRVHSLPLVSSEAQPIGWLQTAGSLESVEATLGSVRTRLFWGIPLVVALAFLGGLVLADRGLRPIDAVTRVAQAITGSALNRRINHRGANDEVGRLANTFDAMLERLEGAFERERRFTADASHELRTPLTALKGRIDVTLSKPRSGPEYVDTLRELDGEVDRLIRLSHELLYLARLGQGETALQPQVVDLSNVLGAVADQVRPPAQAKNLTLTEEVPPGVEVRGDADHLIRLFFNLVDNACKYTPSGGRIVIQAKQNAKDVTVSIIDSGPGIPEAHLPHLFERFYRVDPSRSRDSGGTGLGLSIAYEIAQLHHGKLDVQSQVGSGATFTVTLPAEP